MIVHLNTAGHLTLAEPDDFKRLHCAFVPPASEAPVVRAQLADRVELEGTEAAWIGLDWMRSSASEPRAAWLLEFDRMIEWAMSRGWISPDGQRVKAHVVWGAGDVQRP
ncbi:hypothetical protein AB4Z46_34435 [Variovorax sp. M-6]|uniref:hypothetical protein n=1 Tax=Variovorax sp. M-6 TaxID=3233041 RepID=UPI003F9B4B0C